MPIIYTTKYHVDFYKEKFYKIPTKPGLINSDILLDFNQINEIITMLNSNSEEDINLAIGITNGMNHQIGYEVLVYKLMSTHNWALSDDGSELVRRILYK